MTRRIHVRDLLTGVALMLLGGGVLEESSRMPRYENLGVNPYTAPGIVPAVLGGAILVFGLVMATRASGVFSRRARPMPEAAASGGAAAAEAAGPAAPRPTGDDGDAGTQDAAGAGLSQREVVRRLGLTLALTLVYAGVLVGRLPFWLATFLFVAGFVVAFEWRRDRLAAHLRRVATAALEAAVVAAAVTYIFERIFLVRLP